VNSIDLQIITLIFQAVVVVGTGFGIVYKQSQKVDMMITKLEDHCSLCTEKHKQVTVDLAGLSGHIIRVETKVDNHMSGHQ